MASKAAESNRKAHSWHASLALATALALVLLFGVLGVAQADDPVPSANPDPTGAPPTVTVEHRTYNVFNFPVVGDVLDAVLKGLSDAMRTVTQPIFAAMNLILKTPTLTSNGDAGPGQLNFYAIVEPIWRLAALPMAGVLGFVLLLYSAVSMQVSAINQNPRGIGANMESLMATFGGLVLAAFSLQAFHLLNEANNVLVDMIMQAPGPGQGGDPALMAARALSAAGIASPLASIIIAIILLIPALLLLMMAVARWALFFVIAVLSPLAAVSLGSTPAKRLASLWVQMFFFVMLLGPANAIMLRSIQGLYDVSLSSLGHMEDVPRAVASGSVMFGLLSTTAALNYAAVQRAFGAALGWIGTGLSVSLGGLAAIGAAAGVIAGGGGPAALSGSLSSIGRGGGGLSGTEGNGPALTANGVFSEPGVPVSGKGVGGAPPHAGDALPFQNAIYAQQTAHPVSDAPSTWQKQYVARRREGFDWNRAATIGGSLAAMAPGPVGRVGMAARLLGMAGMVEDRFNRGVHERDQVREESKERWAQADLRDERGMIFGRPSGPTQVERADAIDRAVVSVSQRTSDRDGLRAGLVGLGRSSLAHGAIGSDAYDGIARMGSEYGGGDQFRIEKVAGTYLEAELMSRGTLRGEPVYATGESGTAQVEALAAQGIGRSLGLHDGAGWHSSASADTDKLQQQVLSMAQRLNAVGHLPQGRAYAAELGRDHGLFGSSESLAQLENYVKQIEDGHESFVAGG